MLRSGPDLYFDNSMETPLLQLDVLSSLIMVDSRLGLGRILMANKRQSELVALLLAATEYGRRCRSGQRHLRTALER